MQRCSTLWLSLLAAGALVAGAGIFSAPTQFAADALAEPAEPTGFSDVTASSGLAKILVDQFAKNPKWWLSGIYLIDIDGDGHLDLVTGSHGTGPALAALGDGKGNFILTPDFKGTEVRLCADINEDGKIDLLQNEGDGGGRWWINESTPGHVKFTPSKIHADQARCNALIDINRDGKVDWLHERPGIVFELGDGAGNFAPEKNISTGAGKFETNIHYGDLQGKGRLDLAAHWGRYENEKGQSRVYYFDFKGDYANATTDAGLSEANGFVIKGIGDVNQDGFPDIIALEDKKPVIYLNDGKGHFTKLAGAFADNEDATKPIYVSWGLAVVTDFDNDGIADILWNGRQFLWVFRGLGGGKFEYMNKKWGITDYAAATVDDGLCFGDIDGDGRLDILSYAPQKGEKYTIKVYHNDLPAQHWLNVRPIGAAGNINAAGARIRITPVGGDPQKPLWNDQVQIIASQSAHSYYSYATTERHYGLGKLETVDVEVQFFPSGKKVAKKSVPANTTIEIKE